MSLEKGYSGSKKSKHTNGLLTSTADNRHNAGFCVLGTATIGAVGASVRARAGATARVWLRITVGATVGTTIGAAVGSGVRATVRASVSS